jgi:hypothetical protein
MRTEDDLRAAFRALERHTPDAGAVLRAVYDHSPGSARQPSRSPRRPGRRGLHAALLVATAVAVTAVAAVVAVALGPAASGGAPAAGPGLRARLLAAIDHARGDVLFWHGPSAEGGSWASPWYPRPGQRVRVRILGLNTAGMPAKDAEYIFTMPSGRRASPATDPIDWGGLTVSGTLILVDHARHAWGEWPHQNISVDVPVNAAGIRSEIAAGQLEVIGRTELRGHQAIELGITVPPADGGPVRVTTAHLWVDAATYLPMQQVLRFSTGRQDVTDYSFLPPTAANLAKLRPVIPAGYHRATGSLGAFMSPGKQAK